MENVIFETEPAAGRTTEAARTGSQDRQITMRLPSNLLDDIDQMAQGNGAGRSELIREMLGAVLIITRAGLSAEQLLVFNKAFLVFLRWVNDPLEHMIYLLFRRSASVAEPQLQKQVAISLAKDLISYAGAITQAQKEGIIPAPTDRAIPLGEIDEEALAEEFLKLIQKFDLTRTATEVLDEHSDDEDEEE